MAAVFGLVGFDRRAKKPQRRSVWSRVGWVSITEVRPGVFRPASRMADFTCAEATVIGQVIGTGRPSPAAPSIVSGMRSPGFASMRAPIRRKGSATRPIRAMAQGLVSGQDATERVGGQDFPSSDGRRFPNCRMSSTDRGSDSPPTPRPMTRQAPFRCLSISAPNARRTSAVASTSAPSNNPVTVDSPIASAPSMRARCEIDLSPGGGVVPLNPSTGFDTNGRMGSPRITRPLAGQHSAPEPQGKSPTESPTESPAPAFIATHSERRIVPITSRAACDRRDSGRQRRPVKFCF